MMGRIISVSHVSFRYEGTQVKPLDDVTLAIEKGSIFGLVGQNGAGKTTLLHILFGSLRPTEGSLEICGYTSQDVPRGKMSFLTERPFFHTRFRLREYLFYLDQISAVPRGMEVIDALIGFVHLTEFANDFLKNFSKGMLQRVGIAQALLNEPEILILDEPMSGLDIVGQDLMRDVIRKVNQQGTTVIISSHNLYEIERLSGQVGFLHNGKVKLITAEELAARKEYKLELDISRERQEALRPVLDEILPDLRIHEGRIYFPMDKPEEYFALMTCLTEQKIRVIRLEPARLPLETLIMNFLTEEV